MSSATFVDACLTGRALAEDIDDWVDRWHDANGCPQGHAQSLDEFLGMTPSEGALWAEKPEALRFVVAAHRYGRSVDDILRGRDEYALAARGGVVRSWRCRELAAS